MDAGSGGVIYPSALGYIKEDGWYHVVFAFDNITGKLNLNHKFYINGKDATGTDTISYSGSPYINSGNTHRIGFRWGTISQNYGQAFNGYLSNIHFVDGATCSADYFGKYENGKWVAKEYEGGYGNNGFYLDFAPDNMEYNSSGNLTIVKDSSGNGNHWTVTT